MAQAPSQTPAQRSSFSHCGPIFLALLCTLVIVVRNGETYFLLYRAGLRLAQVVRQIWSVRYQGELHNPQNRDPRRKSPSETVKKRIFRLAEFTPSEGRGGN